MQPNDFRTVIALLGPEVAGRLEQRHRDQIARMCGNADPKLIAWRVSMELRQEDAFAALAGFGCSDPKTLARAFELLAGGAHAAAAAEQALEEAGPRGEQASAPTENAPEPSPAAPNLGS